MKSMKEVGLDIFHKICDAWELSSEERSTLLRKTSEGDQILQISYILGIYKALHILFPESSRANAWIRRQNRYFDGKSALEIMLEEDGCKRVRKYLDSQLV